MKLNIFQKILLFLYCVAFVYFSIIHVPFKVGYDEIEFDTLFSNKSDLATSRFIIILVVISIISASIFFLLRSLTLNLKFPAKSRKLSVYMALSIVLLGLIYLVLQRLRTPQERIVIPFVKERSDSTKQTANTPPTEQFFDSLKRRNCTPEIALNAFRSYMKFYYPDWKIYGTPIVKEMSQCIYRVQFSTLDPHLKLEKEIIVAEITLNEDGEHYRFNTVRGTLY